MKILVQECEKASVTIDGQIFSSIGYGELILVGFSVSDDKELVKKMTEKLLKLRIFPDENGKTNLSLDQKKGEILAVSQFTLYADVKDGNRPSFVTAQRGEKASELYDYFISLLKERVEVVKTGVFGADMKVSLINDGPFTIMLDSKELFHE